MDVSVLYKRAQRWLHGVARPAVLGNGMLERARATSLALLGFTAAVGLAIVALAANQSWPLIAGSSIPTITPRHAAVGPGVAVAGLDGPARADASSAGGDESTGGRGAAPGRSGSASPAAPPSAPSSELVVSPAAPAPPRGGDSPGAHKPPPKPGAQPTRPTAGAPAAAPAPAPAPSPTPAEPPPPVATSSEAPPEESESNIPSWSRGHGHAYGRDSSDVEGDDEWDDHGHGHHDD
jgi:hypothetical protein